mmetsp:Transcript_21803/g.38914  ORF Transcript_21803/g.38914 Transcript_21803/m.38914 type:complete len:126 (+) Transcript_21803:791-1168(+)
MLPWRRPLYFTNSPYGRSTTNTLGKAKSLWLARGLYDGDPEVPYEGKETATEMMKFGRLGRQGEQKGDQRKQRGWGSSLQWRCLRTSLLQSEMARKLRKIWRKSGHCSDYKQNVLKIDIEISIKA